jgi:hypothetical protein
VKWLVEVVSKGNRSAFADSVGVSHPTISKVVAGKPPGRKLLTLIAQHLKIASDWLLTGEGRPFRDEAEKGGCSWVPVSATLLPGAPQDSPDLVSREWVIDCRHLFRPSQYWYRLSGDEPILREPSRGFLVCDLILLESDRRQFPREARLADALCVVRFPGGSPPRKLAAVWFGADEGDHGLRCDPFDLDPDPASRVEKVSYYHYPDGRLTCAREQFVVKESGKKKRVLPLDCNELTPVRPRLANADIVAVWTGILHRPGRVPVE